MVLFLKAEQRRLLWLILRAEVINAAVFKFLSDIRLNELRSMRGRDERFFIFFNLTLRQHCDWPRCTVASARTRVVVILARRKAQLAALDVQVRRIRCIVCILRCASVDFLINFHHFVHNVDPMLSSCRFIPYLNIHLY